MGVQLESLSAKMTAYQRVYVVVMGELHIREGMTLGQNIALVATLYDDSGGVVAITDQYFMKEKFHGFEVFKLIFDPIEMPLPSITKVRIYPKAL